MALNANGLYNWMKRLLRNRVICRLLCSRSYSSSTIKHPFNGDFFVLSYSL